MLQKTQVTAKNATVTIEEGIYKIKNIGANSGRDGHYISINDFKIKLDTKK
jgi:hypothetical protein